ncbi:MAG: hypothetical protein H7Y09_06485, partial [Chitinophagaceae bacterium]|nr:hypothetical protein [Anaerolineae bacterium]
LAYLWKQEADSSEKLAEINAYREFSAQEWDGYIGELVEQNWVSRDDMGNYALNTAGKAVRDEAEQLTDTYFYTPWSILSDAEIAELRGLLMQLRNALEDIAAE